MPTSSAVRIPSVLLSTLDFRYTVKAFWNRVETQKDARTNAVPPTLLSETRTEIEITLYLSLPLVQVSSSDSSEAGVMPSLCVVINMPASAASVILVPRAKRHKGGSVDSLPAEKTGPLLIFRFEPFQSAPVAPPTFNSFNEAAKKAFTQVGTVYML